MEAIKLCRLHTQIIFIEPRINTSSFSSRRRHTRLQGDWSSDVCSSDLGLEGEGADGGYDADAPYTPAWQEKITGVPRDQVIAIARQFADNAEKTRGKSMVIIGAAMNHWYHCDMNYRGIINMLMLCGCIGQSGGGWAPYVGPEKRSEEHT